MKVLLITPPGNLAYREECCSGVIPERFIPAQMLLAVSYLRKQGVKADFIEGNSGLISLNRLRFDYDLVIAWASLWSIFYQDIKTLEKAKAEKCLTALVLHECPSSIPQEVMRKFAFIDFFILGQEIEWAIGELIKALTGEKSLKSLTGIIYRENGKIIDTGYAPYFNTLRHLDTPAPLDELPLGRYQGAFILWGRGCPYSCAFCSYRQSPVRYRPKETVFQELSMLSGKNLDINLWTFGLFSKAETSGLMNLITKSGLDISFKVDCRVEQLDSGTAALLKEAGCKEIIFGIESSDPEIVRKSTGKDSEIEQIKSAVDICHNFGLTPRLQFITGLPFDTRESIMGIAGLVKTSMPCDFFIQPLRPVKGLPIYSLCEKHGLIKKEFNLDDYVKMYDKPAVVPTLYLTEKELARCFYKLYLRLLFLNTKVTLKKLARYRSYAVKWLLKLILS